MQAGLRAQRRGSERAVSIAQKNGHTLGAAGEDSQIDLSVAIEVSNRDGIGARITVKVGPRVLVDEVRSGSSYDSNNDMRVHFGLGAATKIEWVQIRWPSGLTEQFDNIPVDSIRTLKEGSGATVKPAKAS